MQTVAVCGVDSAVACKLLTLLDQDASVDRVIGVGRRPPVGEYDKLDYVAINPLAPWDAVLADRGAETAIFLAFDELAPTPVERNLAAFRHFLKAATVSKCSTLTLISSVLAYGAREDHHEVLYEGTLLNPSSRLGQAYLEVEKACYEYVRTFPSARLQILRPALTVGPDTDNILSRALKSNARMLIPGSADIAFQFVHEDDLARAVHHLVLSDAVGIYNLAADSALTLEQTAQLAEVRLIPAPELVLKLASRLPGPLTPPMDLLSHFRYSSLIANIKFRNEVYFDFLYSGPEAWLDGLMPPEPTREASDFLDELPEDVSDAEVFRDLPPPPEFQSAAGGDDTPFSDESGAASSAAAADEPGAGSEASESGGPDHEPAEDEVDSDEPMLQSKASFARPELPEESASEDLDGAVTFADDANSAMADSDADSDDAKADEADSEAGEAEAGEVARVDSEAAEADSEAGEAEAAESAKVDAEEAEANSRAGEAEAAEAARADSTEAGSIPSE